MFYLEFNLRILHFFNFIISEFLSDEDKIICDYVIIGNYRYVTVLCNENSVIVNYVITPFCGEKGEWFVTRSVCDDYFFLELKNWKNHYGLSQLYLVWITINPRNTYAKSSIERHRVEHDGSQEDETVFISIFLGWPSSLCRRFISNSATLARVFSFRKWTPWHCHVTWVWHLATPKLNCQFFFLYNYTIVSSIVTVNYSP